MVLDEDVNGFRTQRGGKKGGGGKKNKKVRNHALCIVKQFCIFRMSRTNMRLLSLRGIRMKCTIPCGLMTTTNTKYGSARMRRRGVNAQLKNADVWKSARGIGAAATQAIAMPAALKMNARAKQVSQTSKSDVIQY